jgi:hypothetical protein
VSVGNHPGTARAPGSPEFHGVGEPGSSPFNSHSTRPPRPTGPLDDFGFRTAKGARLLADVTADMPSAPLRIFVLVVAIVMVAGGAAFGPLYGVAALAAVVVGLFLLRRPDIAAISCLALSPALSGLKRGLPIPGVRISELLVAAAAVIVLVLGNRKRPRWNTFDWLFLAYAVGNLLFGLINSSLHGISITSDVFSVLVGPFQFLLIFRVARTALTKESDRQRALRWIIVASVPVSGLAVAQRFGGSTIVNFLSNVTDSSNYQFNETYFTARVTGPFSHWHLLGGYLMVIILASVALMMENRRNRVLALKWLVPILLLNLLAVALTLTITIILGVIGGIIVVALMTGRAGRYLGYLAITLGAAAFAASPLVAGRITDQFASNAANGGSPYIPQTLSYRITVWTQQYGPALHGRWVSGYGPSIPPEVTWKYTESLYISLLLRGGIPLLILFAAFQGSMYFAARKQLKAPSPTQQAAARVVAAIAIVLVPMHAIFPYFASVGLPHLIAGMAGLMLSGYRRPGVSEDRAESHETGEHWDVRDAEALVDPPIAPVGYRVGTARAT